MGPRRAPFVLYTFRHTSITRWAKHMDPFTLHVLAGHTDMKTTKRYVHPSDTDILEAMGRVRAAFSDTASMTNRTMLPIVRTMDAHSGRRHCSTARKDATLRCRLNRRLSDRSMSLFRAPQQPAPQRKGLLMRLLLGCAMVFLVICFVGCGTSSPSPCEALKNQARQQHSDFSAKTRTWADQAKTRSRPPSEIQEETLREATKIRAWFLENVFGVEDIDATQSFPETMSGCSGSGLRELRGIGTMEMNFLDSIIAEYKKPLRGKREGQRRAQK